MVSTGLAEQTRLEGRLEDLYVRHAPAAGRFAYLLTADHGEAEDLVQEAFVRVVGRFGHLRVPGAFHVYLRRTIVNLHASKLRRKRVERAYLNRERNRPDPQTPFPDVGLREQLWRAVHGLPARQRAAVVLRYYEDLSEKDAAEILRCSPGAMKSLVARAIETLRAEIGGEEG